MTTTVYAVIEFQFRDKGADEEKLAWLSDAATLIEGRMCRPVSNEDEHYSLHPDATAYASLEDMVLDAQDIDGAFKKLDSKAIARDNSMPPTLSPAELLAAQGFKGDKP